MPNSSEYAIIERPHIVYNNASVANTISIPEEENILKLIREPGGEILLSTLSYCYKAAHGEDIQCRKKKLRELIGMSDYIGTRRHRDVNDTVAFEKIPRMHQHSTSGNNGIPTIEELVGRVESISFSAAGKTADEPQIDCKDIVEKLMGYMGGHFRPTIVHQDSLSLLSTLPIEWSEALSAFGMEKVSDISLDFVRRPYCWHDYQRKNFSEVCKHVDEDHHIHEILTSLQRFV